MENNNNNSGQNSDSLYSYSYLNQENQDRNPNYYERKEENSQPASEPVTTHNGERIYTAGEPYQRDDRQFYTTGQTGEQQFDAAGQTQGSQQTESRDCTDGQTANQWNPGADKKKKPKKAREKKHHGFGMTMAKCAALALVFGLVSGTVFYGTGLAFEYTRGTSGSTALETTAGGSNKKDGTTSNTGNVPATGVSTATIINDVSDIVENVMPSIVSITNMGQTELGRDFFGRSFVQDTESAGSGIIIGQTEEELYVATNNHVVANATQLTVNFHDDQNVVAEIKGTDPSTDLAVLSIPVKSIPAETMEKIKVATLGNSENVRVGQAVVAIGNALGYGQSVTTGVISAVDREVTVQDENTGTSITNDLLQTSAAINPGNSGGALLNMNGEVIGINSVKYSDTQVEGMGFSIPVSAAEPIINDLITREIVDESNSAYLGVSGQDVTEDLAEDFGMPEGLYITFVQENSAAEQAGIKKGDVITEFDGRKIRSMEGLSDIIQYYAAGSEVEIIIQTSQNGEWQEQKVTARLGKKNTQAQ